MNEQPFSSRYSDIFTLQGKVALVTGASGGIGRVAAVALAEAGATLGLNGTDREKLEETRSQIVSSGGQAIVLPTDLQDPDLCERLVGETVASLGRLDILINNAGVNRRKPTIEVTLDDYETIMAINLRSAFLLCQAAYPALCAQGGGKIVNIGSMTSFVGLGNLSVYGMTKAALAQLTKTLAVEWAKDNIQANCIAPGFIHTPLTEKAVWGDEKIRSWLLERIPARRPGRPEDLIGTLLLLASAASDYLTGQTIAVDGGFLAGASWAAEA